MPSRTRWWIVPLELDPETATRLIWLMAALSFLLAIVSGIGEYLGWWDLVGEIGMTIGGTAGLLLTGVGIFTAASRDQVRTVHEGVQTVHETVLENGEKLGSMDGKLDKLEKLDVIEEALVAEDGEASKLDVVQVELDRQTGVLDRQLAVLGEIRDAL